MTDLTLFDYTSLDSNTARLAKESAIEIKARERAIWENIIAIGNKLIEVKNALPRGRFDDWVKFEFKWGRRTAYKYIKVANELRGKVQDSARFYEGFEALYALAAGLSKADEETKQEVLEQVKEKTEKKGEPLTEKEIKELPLVKELKEERDKLAEEKKQLTLNVTELNNKLKSSVDEATKLKKEIEAKGVAIFNLKTRIGTKQAEINKIKTDAEEKFKNKVGKAKEEAVKEYIAKNTKELENQIERLTIKKNELTSKVAYKTNVLENLIERLNYLGDTEKRLSVLSNIQKKLNDLTMQLNADSMYLLAPPTDEMIPHYEFISNELIKWGSLLKEQIDRLNNRSIDVDYSY